MKKFSLLFTFFIWYLIFNTSKAQEPVFKNYSTENGLPSSEVYRVLQDKKGYIWFATDGGVCRFDGNNFRTYTTKDGLCDNTILHMFEDYKGRIWFRSFSGKLSYFYNDSIYNLPLNSDYSVKIKPYSLNSINIDKKDTILLGLIYNMGICKMSLNGKIHSFIKNIKDSSDIFIYETNNGFVYGSYNTLKDCKIKKVTISQIDNEKFEIPLKNIKADSYLNFYSIKLKNHDYVLSQDSTLIHVNKNGFLESKKFKNRILSLYEDDEENLWVGIFKGGVIRIKNSKLQNGDQTSFLHNNSVTNICQDKEGGYWYSTLESGIFYTPSFGFLSFGNNNDFLDNKVQDFLTIDSSNILVVFHDRNLYRINLYEHKIKRIHLNNAEKEFFPQGPIYKDKKGNVWIGCLKNIVVLKSQNKIIHTYSYGGVTKFYEDVDTLVVGTTSEIFKYVNFVYKSNLSKQINPRVSSICGKNSLLYIGSLDGLWSLNGKNYTYLGNHHSLLKNRIIDIKKDVTDNLWLASKGSGVLVYTPDDKVYQINEKLGLTNDLCNALQIDKKGIVWVGTNNGLSKIIHTDFIHNKFTIENYNTNHGLISNQITQVYVQGDNVWLGTNKGLTLFNANNIHLNKTPPPIYINKISINNKTVPLQNNYILKYKENNVEFHYAGLAYKNAGKIKYKIKLEGIDTAWSYTYNTSIRLSDLSPGLYTFKVAAANLDGYWSVTPATVTLTITPPFWLTWWFISLTGFVFVVGSIFSLKYRIKNIENRETQKTAVNKRMAELELKALKARMNPHFLFNTMNSIQHYVVKHQPQKAYEYFTKYTKLMRAVFDYSSEPAITLDEEIKTLNIYLELESVRFENKFNYEINIDPLIDTEFEKIPPLLIQPYVENAIWHGLMNKEDGIGILRIEISKHDENTIKCIVEDNGVGRTKAQKLKSKNITEHKSGGMAVTRDRLQLLIQAAGSNLGLTITDLFDNLGNPCGTKVEIFIPLQ